MVNRYVLSGIALVLLGAGGWIVFVGFDAPTLSQSPPSSESARLREAEDRVLLDVYVGLIDRIRFDDLRVNLTEDRSNQVMLAAQFLHGLTQRYSEDSQASLRVHLILAYQQLGHAHLLLRDYPSAESALRESRRICRSRLESGDDLDLKTLLAVSETSLAWTLSMMGRFDDAATTTRAAVSVWENLIEGLPERTDFYTSLAVCRRNLAIILENLGEDGTAEAAAAVRAAAVFRSHHDVSPYRYNVLIDTGEVLSGLLWKRGRNSAAAQAYRTRNGHIHEMIEEIESRFDSTEMIPSDQMYRDALVRSEGNLALLETASEDPESTTNPLLASALTTASWDWHFLSVVPGLSLGEEFVTRGNRLPGDFEPHDALLLSWAEPWTHEPVQSIISAVHEKLPVVLMVSSFRQQQIAERVLAEAGVSLDRIEFIHEPADTVWIRDYGPLCVQADDGTPSWIDPVYTLEFLGDLPRYEDDEFPLAAAEALQVPATTTRIMLEGGGILSNGAGICLVSSDVLGFNQRIGIGEAQLTNELRRLLGAEQVVYLDPLVDEPNGHLDWFCTFTSPGTIVVGEYGADDPTNRALLDSHARRLAQLETPGGKLNVVRIPMPPRCEEYFGGSYTNVIFANGVLVLPTWPEASREVENQVIETYQQLLPGWEIVPLPSRRLGIRMGGPHCCSINLFLRTPVNSDRRANGSGT